MSTSLAFSLGFLTLFALDGLLWITTRVRLRFLHQWADADHDVAEAMSKAAQRFSDG